MSDTNVQLIMIDRDNVVTVTRACNGKGTVIGL